MVILFLHKANCQGTSGKNTVVTKIKSLHQPPPPGHTQSWLCQGVHAHLSHLALRFHPVCAVRQVLLNRVEKGSRPSRGETGRALPR